MDGKEFYDIVKGEQHCKELSENAGKEADDTASSEKAKSVKKPAEKKVKKADSDEKPAAKKKTAKKTEK